MVSLSSAAAAAVARKRTRTAAAPAAAVRLSLGIMNITDVVVVCFRRFEVGGGSDSERNKFRLGSEQVTKFEFCNRDKI